MLTSELENELRSTFARAAADFENPEQARQRLVQRNYRPRRGSWRLTAGITAAATGAALALSLGLSGVFGSGSQPPLRLTAFSVVSNHNGTVTLTLRPGVPFHPSSLRRLLARHGVPALVREGSYCYSNPAPSARGAVRTIPKLKGYPPGDPLPKVTRLVINARELRRGTEVG